MVRAWELTGFGLDKLALVTRPQMALAPGQVRVAVKAVSINYRDHLMIAGSYDPRLKLPIVPCSDASGEVIELGAGVTRFAVGDRVVTSFAQRWLAGPPTHDKLRSTLGGPLPGTLASELVLDADGLARAPAGLSYEEAATLPCAGLTAWHALVDHGRLAPGDTVLVQGTGGVSIFALQIARAVGARVIATSSSPAKRERLVAMGAESVLDYVADPDWGKTVKQHTGGRGVDQVVEVGGAGTLAQSLRAVAVGGIVHVIGILTGTSQPLAITPILMNEVRLQGIMVGPRESLEALIRGVDAMALRPVIDRLVPFADAPAAMTHLASGAHFGKIVVGIKSRPNFCSVDGSVEHPAAAMQEEGKTPGHRWLALDLLRFVAVFLMVQGHTFTELLSTELQHERWYRHHQFVHGYTAPMFLFASGLAFGYTTFRSWSKSTQPGDALYKRLRRYGWLLVIGYLMHVPTLALGGLVSAGDGPLHQLLQVDVLQHIGVSLCALQLLAFLAQRFSANGQRTFVAIVGVLFACAVLLAPIVWAWPAEQHVPLALAGFVNGGSGSYFPLLPWAGFTYAGVLVAFVARRAERPSRALAPWLLVTTLLALGVPVALNRLGVAPYGPHDFWRTDPYYFFFRLGNVTGVLTVLAYLEVAAERLGLVLAGNGRIARALRWVRVVGEESLVVYVAHLVALHGWVIRPGMAHTMGHQLSLVACSLVALALFASMVLVARGWSDLKKSRLRWQALQLSAAGGLAYLMLIAR